ncbi:alkylphosphonate utilization protein [Cypionkella sp.]|uniref:PhnA domain-containing protein n=1 Tax=Cypionkella sp. TaxID=2811411 RepID=UPI00262B0A89|nr:alkylphosphonate utilization protein [Cypionkella sp.]MDB5665285.1 PhnA protein [Cypionkella sp.]
MALSDLLARAGNACEFCGAVADLEAVDVLPAGEILLCPICREDVAADASHWRCLEGAAWSAEPAVQLAVWRKLGQLDAPWAVEAREGMSLSDEVQGWAEVVAAVQHRDSNGVVLVAGDSVMLIKDLVVKGANFTAKRGTSVRRIPLVADNPGQIEGKVEGQRIVILTEFVKKT